jgi:hypothetical protein
MQISFHVFGVVAQWTTHIMIQDLLREPSILVPASAIRALSPALAVKFKISPGRWQHFPMWPLFLQRDKGKRTEMTGTQHVGNLKLQFLHYITIQMVLVIFHYQNNILVFCTSVIW